MSHVTDTNRAPYFDDYDEEKGFHSILFRPSPVQARELNQMQSILQTQISRLGAHLFAEGSMIIPGGVSLKLRHDNVKFLITSTTPIGNLAGRTDLYVRSRDKNVQAKVSIVNPAVPPATAHQVFIDYISSGDDSVANKLEAGDAGYIYTDVGGVTTTVANITVQSVGIGSTVQVNSGIYFIRGTMVRNEDQSLIISPDVPVDDARVGFLVSESIVTENDDDSLYSNATGYRNFRQAGAHRLKMSLKLSVADMDDTVDNFVELVRIDSGALTDKVETTTYSIIEKAIAQRTFEQAGDYNVDPHELSILDHPTDADKIQFQLKPGVSYVRGYRVENIGPINFDVDRARTTKVSNNAVTAAVYGRYINVTDVEGSAHIGSNTVVKILDAGSSPLAEASLISAQPTVINGSTNSMRLYLSNFDVTVMNLARKVRVETSGSVTTLIATIAPNDNVVYDTANAELLFPTPVRTVKTLAPAGSGRDTSYTVMKSYRVTLDNTGAAQFSAGANSIFTPHSDDRYYVSRADASVNKISGGISTAGGVPAGSVATVNLPSHANAEILILAPVIKNDAQPRTKSLTQVTVDLAFTNETTKALAHTDIFRIVSVMDGATDVTNQFKLDNGQRDSVYAPGSILSATGEPVSVNVRVVYEYFIHGAGDYFCVDSYTDIPYEDIPSYTANSGAVHALRDTQDFRVSVDANGRFVDEVDVVQPGGVIRSDIEYYVSRPDVVYVSSDGEFGIVTGVPGESNVTPAIPEMAMRLYDVTVPAYTFDIKDAVIQTVDNRRYTMRDIGDIDKRVENLEYYTTLSALESSAESIQVFDDAGLPRYKNGIAADPFVDWRLVDLNSPDFDASVDPSGDGQLRPSMMQQALSAAYKSGSTYHLEGYINQEAGRGAVTDATQYGLPLTRMVTSRSQPYATRSINVNPYAVFTWAGYVSLKPTADVWKDTQYAEPILINNVADHRGGAKAGTVWGDWVTTDSRTTTQQVGWWWDVSTTTTTSERSGVNTSFTAWDTESRSDRAIATKSIPFMRQIDIHFVVTNMKPNSRVYAFFDNVAVSSECRQDGKIKGGPMITNASGTLKGTFTVPNRPDMRFETGSSSLRFTDNISDSRDADEVSTTAETNFTSNGTLETRQTTVTRTRHLGFRRNAVSDRRQTQTSFERFVNRDPLAQTFSVSSDIGEMISAVDIYFTTKSTDIPVTVEMRTVENGFPTTDVITRKTLLPSEVSAHPLATVPTAFEFDEFLFLEQNREYAIVILADTQDYNVGIAQMGEVVMGGTHVVAKQPSMGVFFTSQNGSTWSPHQLQDLKYRIRRCEFSPSTQLTFESNGPVSRVLDVVNPFKITGSSTICDVNIPSHGLESGDTFTITNAVPSANLDSGHLNRSHTVTSVVDHDTVRINLPAVPSVTGVTGGSWCEYLGSVLVNAIHPFFDVFQVDKTAVVWEYRIYDQSASAMGDWAPFTPDQTVGVGFDGVVRENSHLQYRATLTSQRTHLSPVINADTHNCAALTPRVDQTTDIFQYVTSDIMLDSQALSYRVYIGAMLPIESNMRLFVQHIVDDAASTERAWTELSSLTGISNDAGDFREYEYHSSDTTTPFTGLKFKVILNGNRVAFPSLRDFRMIALV